MTLSDLSIKNPVFAWMLMAGLIFFGGISYRDLGVGQMPDVDFPVVSVFVTWEGAAPEVIESDVADVIEDAVMSIQGLREVSSSSHQGQTEITIEFELERDIDVALQEVQSKIAQAQMRLPRDIDPPIVQKVNPADQPILWLGLASARPIRETMAYVQDSLKDRFQTISGVGDIILGGYVERNLRVWISAKKLEEHQISVTDVLDAIRSQHQELPAGYIETDRSEMNVRTMGEARTVQEFGDILIPRRGGQPIYKPIRIKDVAEIEDGVADRRRFSRVMGRESVGLGIRKQRGANAVETAHRVKERLKEVQKELPEGMNLDVNFDSSQFAEEAIQELLFTLVLSALLTSVVCWLFLGSWSSTLNVLLAIPTSIVGTFLVFKFMGFTLNTFTVLALSLAIGIVVDDAIMMLENIHRYHEQGMDRVQASIVGARQITFAALAASFSLVAIFLPVAFMKGIIGKYFFQFGVAISAAVLLSLLEALTLTPMRTSQFMQPHGQRKTRLGRAFESTLHATTEGYRRSLEWALGRKKRVLAACAILFFASLGLFQFVRKEFVPAQDQSMFLARIKAPEGSSIHFTDAKFKELEKMVMEAPETRRYFAAIGGFSGGEVNSGILFVTLKPKNDRPVREGQSKPWTQQQVIDDFRKKFNSVPDIQAFVQDLSTMGFTAQRGYPIEVSIRGRSWDKLGEYSSTIMDRMRESGLMTDVDTDFLTSVQEVHVVPDRAKAIDRGVEVEHIGQAINALVGGERAGKYTRDGRRYDVRVRLKPGDRLKPEDIQHLWVRNNRGELVQLSEVVHVELKPSRINIVRRGRERSIGIFANVAPGKSQADALQFVEKTAEQVLPEGYRLISSGSAQVFKESFSSLFFALWLGVIVAYMILASQFNSYIHPITVLMALPFSITGALFALLVSRQSLNIYSFIALILLMGIVKKNSILLVEFTNHVRREDKLPVREALLKACPVRLRPILMTSLTTIAAAIPPALSIGPGAETRVPMAVAIIGGVLLSTVLTLFAVPCSYMVFSRLEKKPAASSV